MQISDEPTPSPRLVAMPDIFEGADRKKRPASVTVLKPVDETYAFFRDFSYLPRAMASLDRVETVAKDVHRWFAKGDAASWETRLILEEPPRRLAWASDGGVYMKGALTFEPALGGRATVVSLKVVFSPPENRLAALVHRLRGEDPDTQAAQTLRYLKALLETGEIPTTLGQPSGREEIAAA